MKNSTPCLLCKLNPKGPLTPSVNVCDYVFENDRSNGNKMQMQKDGFCTHSLCQYQCSHGHNVKMWCKDRHRRWRWYLGPVYIKLQRQRSKQLCDYAGNTVLIGNNRVAPCSHLKIGCNPNWNDSIVLNENRIPSVIAELSQSWCWSLV